MCYIALCAVYFKSDKGLLKAFGEKFKAARIGVSISQEKLTKKSHIIDLELTFKQK